MVEQDATQRHEQEISGTDQTEIFVTGSRESNQKAHGELIDGGAFFNDPVTGSAVRK